MVLFAKDILKKFNKKGNKNAFIYINIDQKKEIKVTYKQLVDLINSGSNFFHKKKCEINESISYMFDSSPEMFIFNFICLFNSYKSCPLDLKCDTEDTIIKKLQQTKSKNFFYREKLISKELIYKIKNELKIETYPIKDINSLKKVFKNKKRYKFNESKNDNNIVFILYTSGTTGFPKGVMISKKNLYYGIDQVSNWLNIKNTDVFYIVLPTYLINSIMYSFATLLKGGTVVIPSRYSISNFFPHLIKYKATMTSIVPTINYDLLNQKEIFLKNKKRIKLKLLQIGSAPVSPIQASDFYSQFKIPLIQGYGLTETSHRVTGMPINLDKKTYKKLLKENSIGKAQIHSKVKIIDKNGNEIKKENVSGEIVVSGKTIMKGYLNNKEATLKVIKNNCFFTGDIGYFKLINNKKYYYLLGRSKEIIIKGGINISPIFVEEKLRKSILWAKEIAVVGFPHYRYGEEVGVIIAPNKNILQKDINILIEKLKKFEIPNLSKYETPQSLIITNSDKINKTQLGKIQHIKVKDFFEKELLKMYNENFHSKN